MSLGRLSKPPDVPLLLRPDLFSHVQSIIPAVGLVEAGGRVLHTLFSCGAIRRGEAHIICVEGARCPCVASEGTPLLVRVRGDAGGRVLYDAALGRRDGRFIRGPARTYAVSGFLPAFTANPLRYAADALVENLAGANPRFVHYDQGTGTITLEDGSTCTLWDAITTRLFVVAVVSPPLKIRPPTRPKPIQHLYKKLKTLNKS